MPYGARGAVVGSGGALAATGFAVTGWVIGAITLILVGVALLQLMRRSPAVRP